MFYSRRLANVGLDGLGLRWRNFGPTTSCLYRWVLGRHLRCSGYRYERTVRVWHRYAMRNLTES
jgi:hypothetical protein